MAIILKSTARRLIRAGKATLNGRTYDKGATYAIIDRHDLYSVSHVFLGHGDLRGVHLANPIVCPDTSIKG